MISYLQHSPDLQKIRFNKRAFSLLHNAVIKPEHLDNFYRTYRIPRHPFFPLFFMIKREYLDRKEQKKSEKEKYINRGMKKLPSYVDRYFNIISDLEMQYNGAGQNPVYKKNIIPTTKKQVDLYSHNSHSQWLRFSDEYFKILIERYERIPEKIVHRISACFILQCLPETYSGLPESSLVKSRYRKYSKKYHPDTGGDPELFIRIKWARDLLLREIKQIL